MKEPIFYPPAIDLPEEHRTEEFLLRPLLTDHVELDYAALMQSKEMLRRWSGGSWPADNFDLVGNLADLAEHQREHESRVAFTYTVLTPDEDECLGCVYIEPLVKYLEMADDPTLEHDATSITLEAVIRFWVTQPKLKDNLDRRLFLSLDSWVRDEWRFRRIFFRVNNQDERQVALMDEASLQLQYALDVPGRNGRYLLYESYLPVDIQRP